MAGHVHAVIMASYAEDAKTNDKPWRLYQWLDGSGIWMDFEDDGVRPSWHVDVEYRRKSKTININGFDVPEAHKRELEKHQEYYYICFDCIELYAKDSWDNFDIDKRRLEKGIIHLTKEAAIQHATALLSFTERKE